MLRYFLKKPIKVQAVQFLGVNKHQVFEWARSLQANVYHDLDESGKPCLVIPTNEGEMKASIGDYIIVEPFPQDGRVLYPCKKSIFELTYDV